MIASLFLMVAYVFGMFYATTLVLQLTGLTAVLLVLGLLTWIGYTMLTQPPSPDVTDESELDDLRPETINPTGNHISTWRRPRFSTIVEAETGEGTEVRDHVNLYKCKIGKNCKIESYVYMEEGVRVGDNCKIKPHVYIPTGVVIQDDVFLGPGVTFTNDKYPRAKGQWIPLRTVVGRGASIGALSVIIPGVTIGKNAMVGAGSVVTSDVSDNIVVAGNPARVLPKEG